MPTYFFQTVLGGRAKAILQHPDIEEVVTAEPTFVEVQEYATQLARKKRLSPDVVLLSVATLPVIVVERSDYSKELAEAERRIAHRDPDDVDLLALALHLNIPVWSNDNDFEDAGVELYTTGQLIEKLKIV